MQRREKKSRCCVWPLKEAEFWTDVQLNLKLSENTRAARNDKEEMWCYQLDQSQLLRSTSLWLVVKFLGRWASGDGIDGEGYAAMPKQKYKPGLKLWVWNCCMGSLALQVDDTVKAASSTTRCLAIGLFWMGTFSAGTALNNYWIHSSIKYSIRTVEEESIFGSLKRWWEAEWCKSRWWGSNAAGSVWQTFIQTMRSHSVYMLSFTFFTCCDPFLYLEVALLDCTASFIFHKEYVKVKKQQGSTRIQDLLTYSQSWWKQG